MLRPNVEFRAVPFAVLVLALLAAGCEMKPAGGPGAKPAAPVKTAAGEPRAEDGGKTAEDGGKTAEVKPGETPAKPVEPADLATAKKTTDEVVAAAEKKPAEKKPAANSDEPAEEPAEKPAAKPAKTASAPLPLPALIPRSVLFGNPLRARARLSSDGAQLAYLAPVDNVLNVFVAPADKPDEAKQVTFDKKRGIHGYFWAYTNKHILYTQDIDGDENWHVYAVDVATAEVKDLTDIKGVRAEIDSVSDRFPDEILIGLNDRDKELHDLHKVNIITGERKLIQENPGYAGFLTDDDYNVRFAYTYAPDASQIMLEPDGQGGWKEFIKIPSTDSTTTFAAGFDKSGRKLYFIDSRERNTSALTVIDLDNDNKQTLIAENPKADVGGILAHPTTQEVQAVSFTYARRTWTILDDSITEDLEFLARVEDGEVEITGRTLDDKKWTVAYIVDDGPVKFYIYDREAKKATFLFSSRDDLDGFVLVKMKPVIIKSRDNLELVSYLSLPPGSDSDADGRPEQPVPLVLNVHGGPWARDGWGFDSEHQWLANRGYAVLAVNYRGSTGFGKEFINASNGQWAGKMHDDLIDAVNWAVKEKIADKEKVAIMGGSYGGYATLVGLTFTPEVFNCGVDVVGPSSLLTLLQNAPPYWSTFMPVMKERLADYETEEGQKFLLERSPLTHVGKITRPLLIGQGKNDPRVTQVEADQIVAAMEAKMIPVTYVLFPDEGHGFARPANSLAFNAVVEAFLAEHLGGRFQPIGDDFQGSRITVPVGADQVPGLAVALKAMPQPKAEEAEEPKSPEPADDGDDEKEKEAEKE